MSKVVVKSAQWKVQDPDAIRVLDGFNVRRKFSKIDELASDIADNGLYNPLLVRKDPTGQAPFVLIDGNRRLLALKKLKERGIKVAIPVKVLEVEEDEALDIMARANLSREDFLPSEKAELISRYIKAGHSQNNIADRFGLSQSWVANLYALSKMDSMVQDAVDDGKITITAALALARAVKDTAEQRVALREVLEQTKGNSSQVERAVEKVTNKVIRPPGKRVLRKVQDDIKQIIPEEEKETMVPVSLLVEVVCAAMAYAAGETTKDEFLQKVNTIVDI